MMISPASGKRANRAPKHQAGWEPGLRPARSSLLGSRWHLEAAPRAIWAAFTPAIALELPCAQSRALHCVSGRSPLTEAAFSCVTAGQSPAVAVLGTRWAEVPPAAVGCSRRRAVSGIVLRACWGRGASLLLERFFFFYPLSAAFHASPEIGSFGFKI